MNGTPNTDANWEHFLRRRDLEQILAAPVNLTGPVLEIGCGDGYLTSLLRQRFERVIPTDPCPRAKVDGLCVTDAEQLPFPDQSFGLIFSSNVLEHVIDLPKALQELKRVLKPDGVMIHTIPTPTWKFFQFALHPLQLLRSAWRKVYRTGTVQADKSKSLAVRKRTAKMAAGGVFWPPMHGVGATGNFAEFLRFRAGWWRQAFTGAGLHIIREEQLFFHTAHRLLPFRLLDWRGWLGRQGLNCVRAYWLSGEA